MIKDLPPALKFSFMQSIQVEKQSNRARVRAELRTLKSIRGTLEATKKFLAGPAASAEDHKNVGKALWFFHTQGDGPVAQSAPEAKELVRMMIQEVEAETKNVEQELKN